MQNSSFRENATTLSPEIQSLAEEKELGEFRKVYTISKSNTPHFVIGGLCITFGVMIAPLIFSPSPIVSIPGFILLLVGGYLAFAKSMYARLRATWHIYLWQQGFIHEKGPLRQVFRWDQIEAIHRNATLNVSSCKVYRWDGYQLSISYAFPEREELMDSILEEFARQCISQEHIITLPRNAKTFYLTKLDRQGGIGNTREKFSWQDIEMFMTQRGVITLLKKDEKEVES